MNWQQLLTTKRLGMESYHEVRADARNEFQRDFDRLIFSSPFRRLQNKTQVFPLPGSVFVHNRLTHSLEVSCVGRSLGNCVAGQLKQQAFNQTPFLDEIGSIVSAACLAHDLGNPPFGHSGERAIGAFFAEGDGHFLENRLTPEQWKDCVFFEGNANAFRLLTHQFKGRRKGGFALTYSTLASIVKYPYPAVCASPQKAKFGFFTSEKEVYATIATELGIVRQPDAPELYARHPLVYLVEAADDICYQLMDIEDAHKLRILTTDQTQALFMGFFSEERQAHIHEVLRMVDDVNEQIVYLRSSAIGQLVSACTQAFVENEDKMLAGAAIKPLIKCMDADLCAAYQHCADVSLRKIYRSQEVLDIELGGYKIILTLLEQLIAAVFNPNKAYSKQLLLRIPEQYDVYSTDDYTRVQAVLDYVSGMTDVYALDLYRKITGMSMPSL